MVLRPSVHLSRHINDGTPHLCGPGVVFFNIFRALCSYEIEVLELGAVCEQGESHSGAAVNFLRDANEKVSPDESQRLQLVVLVTLTTSRLVVISRCAPFILPPPTHNAPSFGPLPFLFLQVRLHPGRTCTSDRGK